MLESTLFLGPRLLGYPKRHFSIQDKIDPRLIQLVKINKRHNGKKNMHIPSKSLQCDFATNGIVRSKHKKKGWRNSAGQTTPAVLRVWIVLIVLLLISMESGEERGRADRASEEEEVKQGADKATADRKKQVRGEGAPC